MTLSDQLQQLADSAPRPRIDEAVWDRGRALRRRDRFVTSAVVLVVVAVLGGFVAVVTGPPRAFAPASESVPEGAIPSRIHEPPHEAGLPLERDLEIGRGSVAFMTGWGYPVVIGAADGRYHRLHLPGLDPGQYLPPALSPDGTLLAWADPKVSVVRVADLESGDLREISTPWVPFDLRWTPDGRTLFTAGVTRETGNNRAGRIEVATGEVSELPATFAHTTGHLSPDGSLFAVVGDQETYAGFRSPGRPQRTLERELPNALYPDGATLQPLGWTDDHLVLASAAALDAGGMPGASHLVLFTSPDLPESEWTFRILVRDVPAAPLSVAVDLVPDLDGTSSQRLTHDFGEPVWPGERDISWLIGLGVAGALSVLYGLRWLWRRLGRTRSS